MCAYVFNHGSYGAFSKFFLTFAKTFSMWLKELSILNFKNYTEASLEFLPQVNAFAGPNGAGKTNLLDAIHYLALCKSYFHPVDSQHVKKGFDWFMVQGAFEKDGVADLVSCSVKKNQKKQFKRNKKDYQRLADHIGLFPLVMISPNDTGIVTEGSEERRKFVDNVISQTDNHYLDTLIRYNKVLAQRNALLKQAGQTGLLDMGLLNVFDLQLAEIGDVIFQRRKVFAEEFLPEFERYHHFLTDGAEQVSLAYESPLMERDFSALLEANLEKDRALERTTQGVHRPRGHAAEEIRIAGAAKILPHRTETGAIPFSAQQKKGQALAAAGRYLRQTGQPAYPKADAVGLR